LSELVPRVRVRLQHDARDAGDELRPARADGLADAPAAVDHVEERARVVAPVDLLALHDLTLAGIRSARRPGREAHTHLAGAVARYAGVAATPTSVRALVERRALCAGDELREREVTLDIVLLLARDVLGEDCPVVSEVVPGTVLVLAEPGVEVCDELLVE